MFVSAGSSTYARATPSTEEAAMFVEEYLQELRRDRFAPPALLLYARRMALRSRGEMVANPGAVRSVWSLALFYFAAAFMAGVALAIGGERHLAYDFFLATSLGIAPAFALVTFFIGALRDREGYRLSALNVPIALTLLRAAMLPGIVLFLEERQFGLAVACYVLAALTDVADGWIARRWSQVTTLGMVMDPVVDIVFNFAILGGLWAAGLLPAWVFWMAVARYGVLLVGGAYLYLFVGPVRIQPTLFGRLTGVLMSALVALLMLLTVAPHPLAERLAPLTENALGILLIATVVQVVALGWYNLRVMTGRVEEQGRVVGDVRWGAR
jgi:cardiolipin synthase (CMP-forming)